MGFKTQGSQKLTGAPVIATGVATTTTTAASLIPANVDRRTVIINKDGKKSIFLGPDNTVTTANGFEFSGGKDATIAIDTSAEIFAIVDSGTEDVTFMELIEE